jgi:hypothetical protein
VDALATEVQRPVYLQIHEALVDVGREIVAGTLSEELWILPASAIAGEATADGAGEWLRDMQLHLISALIGLAGAFTYSVLQANRKRQKLRIAIEAAVTLRPSNQLIPDSPW